MRRATASNQQEQQEQRISIHALLAESDATDAINGCNPDFISIHALLAESDNCTSIGRPKRLYFYPRSPCGERPASSQSWAKSTPFLSTLSLRRATDRRVNLFGFQDFYPRSPCGERRHPQTLSRPHNTNFYPRSPCGERQARRESRQQPAGISIHALLAESDRLRSWSIPCNRNFYPRSPCGERRLPTALRTPHQRFLSTLSLRRATSRIVKGFLLFSYFYPRSPCGERLLGRGEAV